MKFLSEGPDSHSGASAVYIREEFQVLLQHTGILHCTREVQFLPQPHFLGASFPGSFTTCRLSPCVSSWTSLMLLSWASVINAENQVTEASGLRVTAQILESQVCEFVRFSPGELYFIHIKICVSNGARLLPECLQ